ncbi:hypothetical protein ACFWMJ_23520 [Streptomyces hawaiiensis]|uniref:hypothetical protein n=1 Tax=Streptomyces hawaiiensis TaxID=67305 RepID=UPI00365A0909
MPQFRKRPVVIEARQLSMADYDEACSILAWCGGSAVGEGFEPHVMAIPTLEGTMYADDGDFIIRGVEGEFYPCKPDIFAATYEPA